MRFLFWGSQKGFLHRGWWRCWFLYIDLSWIWFWKPGVFLHSLFSQGLWSMFTIHLVSTGGNSWSPLGSLSLSPMFKGVGRPWFFWGRWWKRVVLDDGKLRYLGENQHLLPALQIIMMVRHWFLEYGLMLMVVFTYGGRHFGLIFGAHQWWFLCDAVHIVLGAWV